MLHNFSFYFEMVLSELKTKYSPLVAKSAQTRTKELGPERGVVSLTVARYSGKNLVLTFKTPKSASKGSYIEKVKLLNCKPFKVSSLKKCDVEVDCSCRAYSWQGMKANGTDDNTSIKVETIKPEVWGPRHGGASSQLCKHLKLLLPILPKFYDEIESKLT